MAEPVLLNSGLYSTAWIHPSNRGMIVADHELELSPPIILEPRDLIVSSSPIELQQDVFHPTISGTSPLHHLEPLPYASRLWGLDQVTPFTPVSVEENYQPIRPISANEQIHIQSLEKFEHDLKFVMDCLAEVLTETGAEDVAKVLPWRNGKLTDFHIPDGTTDSRHIRALNIALQLLNLVEENTAMQIRRQREDTSGATPNRGLWEHALGELTNKGFTPDQIADTLARVHVESVLTGHPTEARRDDIVGLHREIYLSLINTLEESRFSTLERNASKRHIKSQLARLWQTNPVFEFKNALERDVLAEKASVFHYLENIFPEIIRRHDKRLRETWIQMGFDEQLIADPYQYPQTTFGNWVTGDRDGHKEVTKRFELTGDTLSELRAMALRRHHKNLTKLSTVLSLGSPLVEPPQDLVAFNEHHKTLLGDTGAKLASMHIKNPWRLAVQFMLERLPDSTNPKPTDYKNAEEFAADLKMLRRTLLETGNALVVDEEVFPVERDLILFGFHMASLDIRQNSEFHDGALDELREEAGIESETRYPEMTFAAKRMWLDSELLRTKFRPMRNATTGLPDSAKMARAVLGSYDVVHDSIKQHGAKGIGSFIVSMTRDVTDLLAVYLLGRESGLVHDSKHGMVCDVPVVPLLETVTDLKKGKEILREFIRHPITQNTLKASQEKGERPIIRVMLGYSDSNKFDGPISSLWNLHKAQKELIELAREEGVEIEFFHGRGGTVSRGAGPMNHFLQALPHGSLTGWIRFTVQGESIAEQFANLGTGTYNIEAAVAGVTATTLMHSGEDSDENHIDEIMEYLEEHGRKKYRALVHDNSKFVSFYSQATPYDALNRFRIGSREAKRTGAASLDDLRAIPWVFAWNQARFYFPGWYGVGTALADMKSERPELFAKLKEKISSSPFLRYIFTNFEASHSSADLSLMKEYATLAENDDTRSEVMTEIESEFLKTQEMLTDLFGAPMESRRPRMVHTLKLRDQALRSLHHEQIALLKKWRAAVREGREEEADALLPQILITVAAIASGERTTG